MIDSPSPIDDVLLGLARDTMDHAPTPLPASAIRILAQRRLDRRRSGRLLLLVRIAQILLFVLATAWLAVAVLRSPQPWVPGLLAMVLGAVFGIGLATASRLRARPSSTT